MAAVHWPRRHSYFKLSFHDQYSAEKMSYGLALTFPTPRYYGSAPRQLSSMPRIFDLRFEGMVPATFHVGPDLLPCMPSFIRRVCSVLVRSPTLDRSLSRPPGNAAALGRRSWRGRKNAPDRTVRRRLPSIHPRAHRISFDGTPRSVTGRWILSSGKERPIAA